MGSKDRFKKAEGLALLGLCVSLAADTVLSERRFLKVTESGSSQGTAILTAQFFVSTGVRSRDLVRKAKVKKEG